MINLTSHMKTQTIRAGIILAMTLTAPSLAASAQVPDSVYIVTYTTGKAWNNAIKAHEQPYFKEHSTYLSNLRKNGVIQLGVRDREHGILFIYATDLKHAKELIESDVAIVNQLFSVVVEKANVFYPGCVEKLKPKG